MDNYFEIYKKAWNASNAGREYAFWTKEDNEQLLKLADTYNRRDWRKIASLSKRNVNFVYGHFKSLMMKEFKIPKNINDEIIIKNDILIAYNYLFFSSDSTILAKLTKLDFFYVNVRLQVILPKLVLYKEFLEKKQPKTMIDKSFLFQNNESKTSSELKSKLQAYKTNLIKLHQTIRSLLSSKSLYSFIL